MSTLHEFTITIADISIDVHSEVSVPEMGIQERLGPFLGPSENSAARVSLFWHGSEEALSPKGELVYDPGNVWRMYSDGQSYYAALHYNGGSLGTSGTGLLTANPSWDELMLTERRSSSGWRSLLNSGAGELILRASLGFHWGLVFHASCIDDNGRGVLFVGHSGAGKSTAASFWKDIPGTVAMRDDRIAVRLTPAGPRCFDTPWGGTPGLVSNHNAPLSAIILVQQAPVSEIKPIPPAKSAPLLLARAFAPYWDKGLMQRFLSNLEALLAWVPVYLLRFRREPSVISLVRSVI
jgi:hypothetical protein